MIERYKNYIRGYLDESQLRKFNGTLQWESSLSKLFNELQDIEVSEEICIEIIPQLDPQTVAFTKNEVRKYFEQGLPQDDIEEKLLEERIHIGIVSIAIEDYLDEQSGYKDSVQRGQNRGAFSYVRSFLIMALGVSLLYKYLLFGILLIIVGAVMLFANFQSRD